MEAANAFSVGDIVRGRPVEAQMGSRSWPGVAQDLRVAPETGELQVLVTWPEWNRSTVTHEDNWISKSKVEFMDVATPRKRRSANSAPAKGAGGGPVQTKATTATKSVPATPQPRQVGAAASPVAVGNSFGAQHWQYATPAMLAPSLGMSGSQKAVSMGRLRIKPCPSPPAAMALPSPVSSLGTGEVAAEAEA